MAKKVIKKNPADFPTLAFRISQEEKDFILAELERARKHLGKLGPRDGGYAWRKNHVAVEALKIGLKALRTSQR